MVISSKCSCPWMGRSMELPFPGVLHMPKARALVNHQTLSSTVCQVVSYNIEQAKRIMGFSF